MRNCISRVALSPKSLGPPKKFSINKTILKKKFPLITLMKCLKSHKSLRSKGGPEAPTQWKSGSVSTELWLQTDLLTRGELLEKLTHLKIGINYNTKLFFAVREWNDTYIIYGRCKHVYVISSLGPSRGLEVLFVLTDFAETILLGKPKLQYGVSR